MQLRIKLLVAPGDKTVSRALIRVANADGAFMDGQVILEGESVETTVSTTEGQTVEITDMVRPVVFDMDQKASLPLDLTQGQHQSDGKPGPGTPKGEHKADEPYTRSGVMGAPPKGEHADDKHLTPPPVKQNR